MSQNTIKKQFLVFLVFISTIGLNGQTKLASIFGNHMVLQQNTMVPIWGIDRPNTDLTIKSNWGVDVRTVSDKDGNWKVLLKTSSAGGPYSIEVIGSETLILKDVLLGEVWVCSGQSNMQMPVKGYKGQPVLVVRML